MKDKSVHVVSLAETQHSSDESTASVENWSEDESKSARKSKQSRKRVKKVSFSRERKALPPSSCDHDSYISSDYDPTDE